jgi:hypothetical protein
MYRISIVQLIADFQFVYNMAAPIKLVLLGLLFLQLRLLQVSVDAKESQQGLSGQLFLA